VILIDANILLYAKFDNFPQHAKARGWLDEQLNGPARVGLPWGSLLAFLRIATNTRLFSRPLTMASAVRQVTAWLAAEPVWIPQPTERHAEVLAGLLMQPKLHYRLVPDAHLAALAVEHGLTLCSNDRDFALFPGLRWEDPLAR
jgi:toxin-antitoxin system PIN domain toxin